MHSTSIDGEFLVKVTCSPYVSEKRVFIKKDYHHQSLAVGMHLFHDESLGLLVHVVALVSRGSLFIPVKLKKLSSIQDRGQSDLVTALLRPYALEVDL